MPPSRADAETLDASDPLGRFRGRFIIWDPERIYLDGNSLGRLSVDVRDAVEAVTANWGQLAVEAWHDWIELPTRVGNRLGAAALGARPGEVLIADSVTVNLYKLAHAAADHRRGPIVTDAGNFPTDRYVLEGVARQLGRRYVEADSVEEAVDVAKDGVLCLSHVDYRSAEVRDMAAITHGTDALVIWDLSHSVGALEVDLSAADLAVGCTYKYVNAGPGAPAFLYVRRELQRSMRSPIQGWFGGSDQFAMASRYEAAAGIERFAAGTPSIIGITAINASIGLIEEAGIPAIAAKGRSLTHLAAELAEEWLTPLGFAMASPRASSNRGAHLALRHADAWRVTRALIERERVVPDFRPPDIVRLGFAPLYTRHLDVWDAMDRLRGLVERGEHLAVAADAMRVT